MSLYRLSKDRFLAALIAALFLSSIASASESPKLIVQITIDQLRADLPSRYYDRFGDKGFKFFWENGTVYLDAHHAHANTETIVGHTTLSTGAQP
ncbi:alkaline phosphatase family protein, partial [Oleiphilus sp. HI0079]